MGRAKSIVKVGLKSSSSTRTTVNPETIYGTLRRYFSESPGSCLPLADFYSTQPTTKETPVDYWVRLNTAAEVADSHMQQQGSKMENMNAEIAMMFIRNCPDPDLSSVFKCKPISKWSVMEVQEAIDEHQRESQSRKNPSSTPKARTLQVATAAVVVDPPDIDKEEYASVNTAKCVPSKASEAKIGETAATDPGTLERVLSMLERVLERANQQTPVPTRLQPSPWTRFTPCQVCGDKSHSTHAHCMKEKLCLGCFEIGHQRRECPKAVGHVTQPISVSRNQGN